MNFYNDNDAYCAAWLGNLIAEGLIPDGKIETKDIKQVRAADLAGFAQAHFFVGIAGWSLALRLAGWSDERSVWTGSCPCQPFSQAGKRKGTRDERHLWPAWRELVAACRPPVVFGEQVASPLGREWVAGVRSDLEALGYEVGIADLCAAGVGAPHIRQRLWWVADSGRARREGAKPKERRSNELRETYRRLGKSNGAGRNSGEQAAEALGQRRSAIAASGTSGVGNADGEGAGSLRGVPQRAEPQRGGGARRLDDAPGDGARLPESSMPRGDRPNDGVPWAASPWSDFDLVHCADGKARRVESGTFPLASGIPARVGKLRAYGNAIVPQVAATFVRAYLEATEAPQAAEG